MVRQLGINCWCLNLDVYCFLSYVCSKQVFQRILADDTNSRFMKALKAHGLVREDLPYKAPFQPWGSWFALIATAIITFFKGFDAFLPFAADTFIT